MIVYPNAKINIGLNIENRRNDGFHDISTLFYPLKGLKDILEITVVENQGQPIIFNQTGIEVDCSASNNLCIKAYNLFSKVHNLPPMAMHLHKIIPIGAGLGGGSADGAFALQTINALVGKPLSIDQLEELALELGSDCPFFIRNTPSIGRGRGEKLQQIDISLERYYILIVNPGIHVNTGKAYSLSQPKKWETSIDILLKNDITKWKYSVINDFEKVVFAQYPEIEKLKLEMYNLGAIYAAMSGSGSTVFGIFKTEPDYKSNFQNFFLKVITL